MVLGQPVNSGTYNTKKQQHGGAMRRNHSCQGVYNTCHRHKLVQAVLSLVLSQAQKHNHIPSKVEKEP